MVLVEILLLGPSWRECRPTHRELCLLEWHSLCSETHAHQLQSDKSSSHSVLFGSYRDPVHHWNFLHHCHLPFIPSCVLQQSPDLMASSEDSHSGDGPPILKSRFGLFDLLFSLGQLTVGWHCCVTFPALLPFLLLFSANARSGLISREHLSGTVGKLKRKRNMSRGDREGRVSLLYNNPLRELSPHDPNTTD